MASRKRKCVESGLYHSLKVTKDNEVCVVHFSDSNCASFQYFKDCKGGENRLEKLLDISKQRLSQPAESPCRMEESCKLIPEELKPEHGYHRDCYQRFTKNLNRLKTQQTTQEEPRKSGRTSGASESIIFKPDCIFCNKVGRKTVKLHGTRTTEATTLFEKEGWTTVIDTAEKNKDEQFLKRIRGFDLFACEAHYHPSCKNSI